MTRSRPSRSNVIAAVLLIIGLAAALTAAPSSAASPGTPPLAWDNGTTGVDLAMPVFPGDVVTHRLIVTNPSSEPVVASLSVSSVGDAALAQVLKVEIKAGVRHCTDPTAAPTGRIAATGTAAATELGPRRLRAGATLRLCVRITMSPDADNSVQGLSTTTTFRLVTEGTGTSPAS